VYRLQTEHFTKSTQPAGLSAFDGYLWIERYVVFDICGCIAGLWVVPGDILSHLPVHND
jgi:hypothetical protein